MAFGVGVGVALADGDGTGVGVGDSLGVGKGVGIGIGVGDIVGMGVGIGIGVCEGVGMGVGIGIGVCEGVGVGVGDGEGNGDGIDVAVGSGVGSGVAVGLDVGSGVGSGAGSGVGVTVGDGVGVDVEVGTGNGLGVEIGVESGDGDGVGDGISVGVGDGGGHEGAHVTASPDDDCIIDEALVKATGPEAVEYCAKTASALTTNKAYDKRNDFLILFTVSPCGCFVLCGFCLSLPFGFLADLFDRRLRAHLFPARRQSHARFWTRTRPACLASRDMWFEPAQLCCFVEIFCANVPFWESRENRVTASDPTTFVTYKQAHPALGLNMGRP